MRVAYLQTLLPTGYYLPTSAQHDHVDQAAASTPTVVREHIHHHAEHVHTQQLPSIRPTHASLPPGKQTIDTAHVIPQTLLETDVTEYPSQPIPLGQTGSPTSNIQCIPSSAVQPDPSAGQPNQTLGALNLPDLAPAEALPEDMTIPYASTDALLPASQWKATVQGNDHHPVEQCNSQKQSEGKHVVLKGHASPHKDPVNQQASQKENRVPNARLFDHNVPDTKHMLACQSEHQQSHDLHKPQARVKALALVKQAVAHQQQQHRLTHHQKRQPIYAQTVQQKGQRQQLDTSSKLPPLVLQVQDKTLAAATANVERLEGNPLHNAAISAPQEALSSHVDSAQAKPEQSSVAEGTVLHQMVECVAPSMMQAVVSVHHRNLEFGQVQSAATGAPTTATGAGVFDYEATQQQQHWLQWQTTAGKVYAGTDVTGTA